MLTVGIIIGSIIVGTISITKASGTDLTVCVTKDGTMHLIGNSFKRSDCKKNEQLISFNAQGPKGDKGDTGATGAQGIQGIAGPVGPMGPQGIPGEGITQDPGTVTPIDPVVPVSTSTQPIGGSTTTVIITPIPDDGVTSTSTIVENPPVVVPVDDTVPVVPVDVPPVLYIGGSN